MALILYKGTTSQLGLIGLKDINDTPVTNATVTAVLYDRLGNEIGGQSWPLALTHDSGGDYYGTLESDIDVFVNKRYEVEIEADAAGLQATWRESVTCEYAP